MRETVGEPSAGNRPGQAEGLLTLRWRDLPAYPIDDVPVELQQTFNWQVASLADLLPPDDLTRFVAEVAHARSRGFDRVRHADHRMIGQSGQVTWWQTVTIFQVASDGVLNCISHGFDITPLRATEPGPAQWQPLIDSISDLVFVKRPDGVYLACNRAFAEFIGRRPESVVGRTDFDLIGAERARFFQQADTQVLTTRRSHRSEEETVNPEGQDILLETIKTPCHDSQGRLIGLVAVSRDVTDKARAQRELRESERRLSTLLGNLPGMVYRCRDEAGQWAMQFVSDGCRRLTGHPPQELTAEPGAYGRLIHPEDRAKVTAAVVGALRDGKRFTLGYRIVDRSGVVKHVWEQGIGVLDSTGRLEAVEGFIADVSDLKTAEQTLHTLSLVVAQSPVGVAVTDALGKTVYLNPRLRSMTGRTLDGVRDLEAFLACFAGSESDLAEHSRAMWRLLSIGEPWHAELQTRGLGGESVWTAITVLPVQDEEGRTSNVIATADDITVHRQAEEHLRRAQKMQAVGVLAGGVAHDFNNILTAIIGYSHLAIEGLPEDSPARDDIRQVTAAADRAKSLVQQLLAFARKERAGREVIDLRSVVRDALQLVQPSVPPHVALTLCCSEEPVPVLAAATQIHQVLINLCKNAVDAIVGDSPDQDGGPEGVITVTLTSVGVAAPREMTRARLDSGRYACLSVADNGCGMGSAVQERIFEPFFTTKPVDKGTGLGLAAVHGIVADHGGIIDVASAPGGGAMFSIYLPLYDAERSRRAPQLDGRRVLLLDDEPVIRRMTASLLRSQGFQVVSSADRRRGLALFAVAPKRFDLVVLGQKAEDGQAWKLLTLSRAFAAADPGIPILVCAGTELDRDGTTLDSAGAAHFVRRPLAPDQFITLAGRLAGERLHQKQA